MKKKTSRRLGISAILLVAISPIFFANFDDTKDFEIAKNLDIFYSLFNEVNKTYVDELDPGDLMQTAINKMLESLDPYTTFIPESDVEKYSLMTKGEYGGIGAHIGPKDSVMYISRIYKDYPAHKAGLLPGDKIVEVDGRSIIATNPEQVHEMLKGQAGTTLKIGIKRNGSDEILPFTIKREKVKIKSVPYFGLLQDSIGYIKLRSFTQDCASDVKTAYMSLKNQGAKAYILDLRENPGGLLFEAIELTNIFVEKGKKIVFTKGQNTLSEHSYYTNRDAYETNSKLAILVNDRSASASEVVSGSLQDLDRAIIVGMQTYGKGLVQTRKELTHNSFLKVTNSKYHIPSGRCIQKIDYSHRNQKGEALPFPDSVTATFYTSNGRPVKDGAGIIPDILVEEKKMSDLQTALIIQDVILDFVSSKFSMQDTTQFPISNTIITKDLYTEYIEFIKKSNFSLKSKSEYVLDDLKEKSTEEKLNISELISELQTQIDLQQNELFVEHKEELSQKLAEEIMQYLYFEEGRIEYLTLNDDYIQAAKKYLLSDKLYNDILQGNTGTHKK